MRSKHFISAVAVIATAIPAAAAAQHTGHQMGAQTQAAPQMAVAECARAQPQVMRTLDAANMRLEAARQSNSPSAMRAAIDDLQSALGSLRAQLAACATLQVQPADPHAGHAMPTPQQPAAAAPAGAAAAKPGAEKAPPTAPAAAPHAGHDMRKPPAARAEKPAAKPPAEKTKEAPEDTNLPIMPAEVVMDPACPTADKKITPKATYQRKVYYFCSTQDRDEFKKDPAAYLKKRPRG